MSHHFYWMYGLHAVHFALENHSRKIYEVLLLDGQDWDDVIAVCKRRKIPFNVVKKAEFFKNASQDWVHQGILAKCAPLPTLDIEDVDGKTYLVLDHVTDPHNIGAILRTAAAFKVSAVIMQDKNSPEENGALAKTACGALEIIPIIKTVNLSRTLEDLKKDGFWVVGLDERGQQTIDQVDLWTDWIRRVAA